MDENVKLSNVKEREITKKNGFAMLFVDILGYVATVVTFVLGLVFAINYEDVNDVIFGLGIGLFVVSLALLIVSIVLSCGLKSVNPNEAMVFTLFGEYYGTIKSAGFYFINPFWTSFVSLTTINAFSSMFFIKSFISERFFLFISIYNIYFSLLSFPFAFITETA